MRHFYIFTCNCPASCWNTRIWERSGDCGKWAVLGDCLWKFCANFIVGGTSWREWLCGSILHLNIRGYLHWLLEENYILISQCRETTTSNTYHMVRMLEVISFYSINRSFLHFRCHFISLSSIGIVVFIIVGPDEQMMKKDNCQTDSNFDWWLNMSC